jgi:hypothetical protein
MSKKGAADGKRAVEASVKASVAKAEIAALVMRALMEEGFALAASKLVRVAWF